MTQASYEVVIIGSGATGGIAALTFAEAGNKVLVIEAGPNFSPKDAIGSEPLNSYKRVSGVISGTKRIQAQHPGFWKSNPSLYLNEKENPYSYPKNKPFLWTQGRQVGGRSLTWGGITLRLSQNEFKPVYSDQIGTEWPIDYKDLEPHYSVIEKRLNVHGNKDGLIQIPDGIYKKPLNFTTAEINFKNELAKKFEYPFIHSRGFGPHNPNNKYWPKSSSLGGTLGWALRTGKVELLSNHMAEYLTMSKANNSANGVIVVNQINGERKRISASVIIICASTIQTLRLLLCSERNHCKDGFHDPSGLLGKKIMDHLSICRFFKVNRLNKISSTELNYEDKVLSGAGSFFVPLGSKFKTNISQDFLGGYGIWGGINRFNQPQLLQKSMNFDIGFLIAHGEVLPSLNNYVKISDLSDKWSIPAPHISFTWQDNEIKMASHMRKTIEEIIDAGGGEILNLKEIIKVPFMEKFISEAVALNDDVPPPGYYIHELGGAPMGTSENTSVVDKFNRLWRCKNVLVVDGSCWPTSGWQSPTLTMMAITRRACLKALNLLGE